MNREKILQIVLLSDNLPTLPTVASELLRVTSREDTLIGDIAALITNDIALSAKVLKVVNSAFYSFPNQISTIQQAVSILGINAVRSLVLSFSFLKIRKTGLVDVFDYEKFWERALTTAVAAKLLATTVKGVDADELFTAALLQNIGVLILARTLPEDYALVLARVRENNSELTDVENELLGITHVEVGYEVANAWGFPPVLLAPIHYHHRPEAYDGADSKIRQYCRVAHLADILADIYYSDKPEECHKLFKQKASRLLHLNEEGLSRVIEGVDAELQKTGQFFGVNLMELRSIEEILQEANVRLGLLNMSYEQMNRELVSAKVQLQQLAKELEDKNRRLETLANIDGLTEVYNHRYFQETLGREINRSIRYQRPLSLVLADVDLFKNFNDRYGHQTGDFILRETCRAMRDVLRKYDTLARYGGEEFAILLPETTRNEAETVAEKLRQAVNEARFSDGRENYGVTISCGLACMEVGETLTNSELIERADKGLLIAKRKGRNQVICFMPKKGWFAKV